MDTNNPTIEFTQDEMGILLNVIEQATQSSQNKYGKLVEDEIKAGKCTSDSLDNSVKPDNSLTKDEFATAVRDITRPVIEFMNNHPTHLDPHHKLIIDCSSTELLSGVGIYETDEFIED